DYHRHAERCDADDDGLTRNQFQVGGAKELWPDQRTEQRQDERQPDEHPGVVEQPPRGYDARAPDASISSECSFHSVTSRAGPSRPRAITAMRSHMPSSSGK